MSMQFSAKNLPRYIRRNKKKFMYQIWFQGSRLQHTYDTWEEASEGKDEKINQLIKQHPEEEKNLRKYLGVKEGMNRKTVDNDEPTKNKKVAESSNKKKVPSNETTLKVSNPPSNESMLKVSNPPSNEIRSKVSQYVDDVSLKKIVTTGRSTKTEEKQTMEKEQSRQTRGEQLPAAPIAKDVLPTFNVKELPILSTLKHNLPPLNKKEVKEVLPPLHKTDVKEVLPPLNTKEVDSGVDGIKTHLAAMLPDGQKTQIGIRVIDIHKLTEPGKENHQINITVLMGNNEFSFPLKVFEFHQMYKPIPV